MEHSDAYYKVCNNLLKALGEMHMWKEQMYEAIKKLEGAKGPEKQTLQSYIEKEINKVGQEVMTIEQLFMQKQMDTQREE